MFNFIVEESFIIMAQELKELNFELEQKKKEIQSLKKTDLVNIMNITAECGKINQRRDELIEDFIKVMLEDQDESH